MKRFIRGLVKTRERLLGPLRSVLSSRGLGEGVLDEVEALLLSADLGVETTERIIDHLRRCAGAGGGEHEALAVISDELLGIMGEVPLPEVRPGLPHVLVIVGVNGVGKTSTIGKLAHRYRSEGKGVLLAACDTFRAAAIEQLEIWGERVGVPVVRQAMGADPAAVAFDAVHSAATRGIDVVIVDTAGRLHTKRNLMDELSKIFRVIGKRMPEASLEAWLVLDANTGQNSIRQAEVFARELPVTGLVLTKLDSTAKGGAVVPIQLKLRIPVRFVGLGEGIEDLEPFVAREFVSDLLGMN